MKLNIIACHHYNIYCLERPFHPLWLDNPRGHWKSTSKELDILVLLLWCSESQDLVISGSVRHILGGKIPLDALRKELSSSFLDKKEMLISVKC